MFKMKVTLEEAVKCLTDNNAAEIEVIYKPPYENISCRYTFINCNNWLMSYIDRDGEPVIIKDVFVKNI